MAQVGNEFIWNCIKCSKSLQYEDGLKLVVCNNRDWCLDKKYYVLCNLCSYDFIEWIGLKG